MPARPVRHTRARTSAGYQEARRSSASEREVGDGRVGDEGSAALLYSGNEGGEKFGAHRCCTSEDIDRPVQKSTEYQEPDDRVPLEKSLRGFVGSAPRASVCFGAHHVTAIAARLQSGHAPPLLHAKLASSRRKICFQRQSRRRNSFQQPSKPSYSHMWLDCSVFGDIRGAITCVILPVSSLSNKNICFHPAGSPTQPVSTKNYSCSRIILKNQSSSLFSSS